MDITAIIHALKLLPLCLVAIRRNCADARGSTIEEGIKYWLKKGPERLKRNQVRCDLSHQ